MTAEYQFLDYLMGVELVWTGVTVAIAVVVLALYLLAAAWRWLVRQCEAFEKQQKEEELCYRRQHM